MGISIYKVTEKLIFLIIFCLLAIPHVRIAGRIPLSLHFIIFGILTVFLFLNSVRHPNLEKEVFFTNVRICGYLFITINFLSMFYAYVIHNTGNLIFLHFLKFLLPFLVLFYAMDLTEPNEDTIKSLSKWLLVGGMISFFWGIFSLFSFALQEIGARGYLPRRYLFGSHPYPLPRMCGLFNGPNTFGFVMLALFLYFLILLTEGFFIKKKEKIFVLAGIICFLVGLLMSLSRSSYLAFFSVMILYLLFFTKRRPLVIKVMSIITVLFTFGTFFLFPELLDMFKLRIISSYRILRYGGASRLEGWPPLISYYFNESPLFGQGFGGISLRGFRSFAHGTDSTYFNWFVELGAVGVIFGFLWRFQLLKALIKNYGKGAFIKAVLMVTIAFFLKGITSGPKWRHYPIIFAMIGFALNRAIFLDSTSPGNSREI